MAKPLWQQKLQNQLSSKPMCFVGDTTTVKHVSCLSPSEEKGRAITVRLAVNYSFHTCAACGKTVR